MALPKKTSRKIIVDNVAYRWSESVTNLPSPNCRINLVIQATSGTKRRIYTNCVCRLDKSGDREKITTPKSVAAVIRYALSQGWDLTSATQDLRFDDFDRVAGELMPHQFYNPDDCRP
jgi:hypothetical protein